MKNKFFRVLASVLSASLILSAFPVYADVPDNSEGESATVFMPEEGDEFGGMIVVLKENDEKKAEEILEDLETEENVSAGSSEIVSVGEQAAVVIDIPDDVDYSEAAMEAAGVPGVDYVQPDYFYMQPDEVETDEPLSVNQKYLDTLNVSDAWSISKCSRKLTVAVIDSGMCLYHEDLSDNIDKEHAYQIVECDAETKVINGSNYNFSAMKEGALTEDFGTGGDLSGHGTKVGGIIAAVSDNNTGISGITYNAKLLPINVFRKYYIGNDSTSTKYGSYTSDVLKAYGYLEDLMNSGELNDLKVINISLGGYSKSTYDAVLEDKICSFRDDYSVVTVAAGGNGATDESHHDYSTGMTKNVYPADGKGAVSVAATDISGTNHADFSDYNDQKDLAAPGVNIYTTVAYENGGLSRYAYASGTSFAAPCVSAACALIFAYDMNISASECIDILEKTAVDVTGTTNDKFNDTAYCPEGKDIYTGYGLIDIYAALAEVSGISADDNMNFSDVYEDRWYYTYVKYVFDNGIMTGYANSDKFGPNDHLTREQFAMILYRMSGSPDVDYKNVFFDVPDMKWYSDAICWAYDNGIITGYLGEYPDRVRFGTGDKITREQMCTMIKRYADFCGIDTSDRGNLGGFPDGSQVSGYAREPVMWCVASGIISGKDDREEPYIDPKGFSTRAECAAVIMRFNEQMNTL